MEETVKQIQHHIEQTRESLGSHLDELEQKVKSATDWRQQFQTRPATLLSLAFGGGVVLAAIFGAPGKRNHKGTQLRPMAGSGNPAKANGKNSSVVEALDSVKGALIGIATTRLLDYARAAFPAFRMKTECSRDRPTSSAVEQGIEHA